jgi:hypothetical protein
MLHTHMHAPVYAYTYTYTSDLNSYLQKTHITHGLPRSNLQAASDEQKAKDAEAAAKQLAAQQQSDQALLEKSLADQKKKLTEADKAAMAAAEAEYEGTLQI